MPFKKRRSPLVFGEEEINVLKSIATSRTEPFARVYRARMLLAYVQGETISVIARKENTDRPVVERCIDKALSGGIETALRDLQRSGRPPIITDEDKTWVTHLACSKPSEYGFASDHWTFSQLARYIRDHAQGKGPMSLARTGKGLLHKILNEADVKPHKISSYLEKRDEYLEEKMAQALFVYKEAQQMRDGNDEKQRMQTIISYDEKPGIQAIGNIAPDLSPIPEKSPIRKRDYE